MGVIRVMLSEMSSTNSALPAGISRVVFWTEMLSPHLLPYARVLAGRTGVTVQVAAYEKMTADRMRLGWTAPDVGRAEIIIGPDLGEIRRLIATASSATVHILHGIRGWPLGRVVARELQRSNARFGIVAESAMRHDCLQPLRTGVHWLDRLRWGHAAGFVLGIGRRGVSWFRSRGYPAKSLFEFGYVADPVANAVRLPPASGPVQLLYVGRLLKLKGLDLLLRALGHCRELEWKLTILGSGPLESQLRSLAADLGLTNRVGFLPAMLRTNALCHMAGADLLVLPSHPYDGWGAVTNEALQLGVPVICSSSCGCADLFAESWRGEIFRSGSVDSLVVSLRKWLLRGRADAELSERIRRWADCIGAEPMTDYLVSILSSVYDGAKRPAPPWQRVRPNYTDEVGERILADLSLKAGRSV